MPADARNRPIETGTTPVYNNSFHLVPTAPMDYRDPVLVIDETLDNLVYLVEWWLEDLDMAATPRVDFLTWDDVKTVSALRATRALLPRLRIVRSNYENAPSLPDASGYTRDHAMTNYIERSRTQLRPLMNPSASPLDPPAGNTTSDEPGT